MYYVLNSELKDIKFNFSTRTAGRNRGQLYCDNIMCFDIETTTAFHVNNEWISFDIEKVISEDKKNRTVNKYRMEYKNAEKLAICYIWQFSIDDNIFYGRHLQDFVDFLSELNHYCDYHKIIYVHNLAHEFQFLLNVLTFDDVFARKKHKPITATVNKYKIEFRCSYFLTVMSLANWAESKKLPVKKMTGSLDYNVIRTPYTKLSSAELQYCIYDVLVMYYGLLQYVEKYEHVWNIPLTQTGEVRRVVYDVMKPEISYRKKMASLVPSELSEYKRLVNIFIGGSTHANYIYTNRTIHNVRSFDISSSYPFVQVVEKFPMTAFIKADYNEKYCNSKYSYVIHFKCSRIESMLYNTYWSYSRAISSKNEEIDNGRIMTCIDFEAIMTNIDFDIFKQCYYMFNFEIVDFYISLNGYLNDTYRKYILDIYGGKTKLKGIENELINYNAMKQQTNSNFGMAVTKDITDDIIFQDNQWEIDRLDIDKFKYKTNKLRRNISKRVTAYQHGVYVTAYGRRNLWKSIIALDDYVVYYDTDSNKNITEDNTFFDNYNKEVFERSKNVAKDIGVPYDMFEPRDIDGIKHPLGAFEYEGTYSEFKTLGAKIYCYRTEDDILHQTISGIRKEAVEALDNDISNLHIDFTYNEEVSKKLTMIYRNNQPHAVLNKGKYDEYEVTEQFGVCAIPTTHKIGMDIDFLNLVNNGVDLDIMTEVFEIE